ncbi:DNA cytosine methyltransferase [Gaopeijia maritima]|uniref:DNA cytosine methyltransferase n=1 Tax=Gaopeijia maritima TaxID=3119007 RepID=UPI003249A75D
MDPHEAFDLAWLNSDRKPRYGHPRKEKLRLADLFCGAGGLTLGVLEAARALGIQVDPVLGADLDPSVERAYRGNFVPACFVNRPLQELINGDPDLVRIHEWEYGTETCLTREEITFRNEVLKDEDGIDFLVGGPPCQGHSNLNNHTRREDPKNQLYGRMARFALVFKPRHILIENVHGAAHDRGGIMDKTRAALNRLGYKIDTAIVKGEEIGVPQTRHRIFMIASRDRKPSIVNAVASHRVEEQRSFDWSQRGLQAGRNGSPLDIVTKPKPETAKRIAWLHQVDAADGKKKRYDLPNGLRPDCHQNDTHTYKSVYGRIREDRPAPTITTGFTVMGQGRFVHPHEPRTLTPREGARIQFFPNWFFFGEDGGISKKALVSLIGNAVPPKMAYVLALELLR